MFDPTTIHNAVEKIKKQSLELDELNTKLKNNCNKKPCNKEFPQNNEVKKPKVELEEL